jgi:hypothetical protein
MRLYLSADAAALRSLRDGASATLPAFTASSDDEEHEFAALAAAAESATAVVVADVDDPDDGDDQTIALEEVVAVHVDVDGSGDLAWYATQEIDAVVDLLS